MEEVLHVLLHSLIDTAKLLPLLLIIYYLIEFLEYKNIFRFESSRLLKGKASPAIGALVGSIPQCGFSVISSELYAERKISIAALIAVYIATSDEAIPLMLANYKSIPALVMLILCKIIMAILIGYLTFAFYKLLFKNKPENINHKESHDKNRDKHNHQRHEKQSALSKKENHVHACCHHDLQDEKFDLLHPLIHSLKIAIYIFIINLIMNGVIEWVGEENLKTFLSSSYVFQPLLALLIGLIPNCASSVVLTELYLMGSLSFGAIITGLSVNAGLGLLVLFKENKNIKENLFIVFMLIIPSLLVGYGLHFLPINFLRL